MEKLVAEALADGQDFASSKPTLEQLARQRLPIVVPWNPGLAVYPGQTFHSFLYRTEDPWAKRTPFQGWSAEQDSSLSCGKGGQMVYLCADGGTSGTFRSAKTQNTITKVDHESYGFTATVDLGFCNANGTLKYDKNILTNNDVSAVCLIRATLLLPALKTYLASKDIKVSVRSSYRCGSILMRTPPLLSPEASLALKYGDGIEEFENVFGDYYLFGFNLGADNAMMVSTSTASLSNSEGKTLSVKATSLLLNVEHTEHFDTSSYSASSTLSINGYDTLAGTTLCRSTRWQGSASVEFDAVQRETRRMRLLGDTLPSRVEGKARSLGLPLGIRKVATNMDWVTEGGANGDGSNAVSLSGQETAVDRDTCQRLFDSGLVIEMVLLPCRSLRSVQRWMYSDDVI